MAYLIDGHQVTWGSNSGPLASGQSVTITTQEAINGSFVFRKLACCFRSTNRYFSRTIGSWNYQIPNEAVRLSCAYTSAWAILQEFCTYISPDRSRSDAILSGSA